MSRYFTIPLNSYLNSALHYSEPFLQARANVENSTTSPVNSNEQQNNTALHSSEPFLQARSNVESSTTSPLNSSEQQDSTTLHSSEPFLQVRSNVESSTTSPVNSSKQQNNTEAESLLSQLPELTDSNLGLRHHQTEEVNIAGPTTVVTPAVLSGDNCQTLHNFFAQLVSSTQMQNCHQPVRHYGLTGTGESLTSEEAIE